MSKCVRGDLRCLALVTLVLTLSFIPRLAAAGVLLELPFNGNLAGTQGETPVDASGITFVPGLGGGAALLPTGNMLTYASNLHIDSFVGSLEFVLRPNWNGDDEMNHVFLSWGGSGGMIFGKDAANNLRGVFNRYGENGDPEVGVPGVNVSTWRAGELFYLAYTWSNATKELNLYINGELRSYGTFSIELPLITDTLLQIGGADFQPGNLDGTLDEFRISDVELTPAEIEARYAALGVPEPSGLVLALAGATAICGALSVRGLRVRAT